MQRSLFLILTLLLFTFFTGISQEQEKEENRLLFSEALALHLPQYNDKANKAYQQRNFKEGKRLFDSLTNNCLSGSYIDDFRLFNLRDKEVRLHDIHKPIYLITYASWCIPGKGAIPAINDIANKYKNNVQLVVLFWDTKAKVKRVSREFNKNVKVLYVDETQNHSSYVVKQLKHSLGLPTCFLIDSDHKIMDISRYTAVAYDTSIENALKKNFNQINEGIVSFLMKDVEARPQSDLASSHEEEEE
ncbi:TlpA family protein disulfide reductase [Zunongwangia sp. HGR-M22]|uniref:TlpA family protein disulfide reductase n=1 Tax=Zunongwangia sp. HGR-M22 TaxID=3015168 RepID=UPI0022DE9455|nr:redoxin domain-containing protein [Zunongwangia sp. HGR-M22]WBL27164.1 redoxin domain-containing protein [Zunongwangia sp. HGR-M22]